MSAYRCIPLLFLALLPVSALATPLININTADAVVLDTLPGIGPVRAGAIIAYRQSHGSFARIDELMNVKGIGPITLDGLKALVTVGTTTAVVTKTVEANTVLKPSPAHVSSIKVQKVEPVISTVSKTAYEEKAVAAPATTTNIVAAAGAALPLHQSKSSLLASPWLYGFIGVVVFSAAALLLL